MCDKIRPFQGASETTENGYKWSKKSEGYVFILKIVDQNVKKTHLAGFESTAIPQFKIKITEIPHEKLANTAIPQTPMSPSFPSRCIQIHKGNLDKKNEKLTAVLDINPSNVNFPRTQQRSSFINCAKQLFGCFGSNLNSPYMWTWLTVGTPKIVRWFLLPRLLPGSVMYHSMFNKK